MMGMAVLVSCDPLTIRIAQGPSRQIAAISTAPVSTERSVTPEALRDPGSIPPQSMRRPPLTSRISPVM